MKPLISIGLVVLSVVLSSLLDLSGGEQKKGDNKQSKERVAKLFETMHKGEYDKHKFPDLKWEDIPALLELGTSTRLLKNPPQNLISSLLTEDVPEGVVALWLIEGVRKGGNRFPSLNPAVVGGNNEKVISKEMSYEDWQAENRKGALKAYQEWWKMAQSIPREKAAAIDPLKETSLRWY